MANCATELRTALGLPTDTCPENADTVMFITDSGYTQRTWEKIIQCIVPELLPLLSVPDDIEITIDPDWSGRNYYDYTAIAGKRFRLYRDGILLNAMQYRPLTGGGWELLLPGDILEEGQIFTITQY